MANAATPFGLMPVKYMSGAPYTGGGNVYYIPSTDTVAYYIGDPVALLGVEGTQTADADGIPSILKVSTSGITLWLGTVVGILPVRGSASNQGTSLALEQVNIPATKSRDYYVLVADDPNLIFEIQGDSTATNQTAAKSTYNADITVAVPSAGGQSATVVQSGTIALTATLPLKLMGLSRRKFQAGNAFGAYATWYCKINNHQYGNIVASLA
jgi:hypothetical protein